MIGIATKFGALDALRERLASSVDPNHVALAQIVDSNPAFAYLGALGTSLGDFSPVRVPPGVIGTAGTSAYVQIWKLVFNVFGGDGTPANPGLKPVLDKIRELLDKLDGIAAAEDLEALKGMQGEVDTLNQIAADLNAILITIKGDGSISNLGILPTFSGLIGDVSRPAIIRPRPDGHVGFPSKFWNLREFLSWRRTGRFARKLWKAAQASGKDELIAYALGWLSSWSLSACGSSAVASIVGAPYRNQWWRTRFVGNYVDVWAYGHTNVGPDTAPYSTWPNLCSEELHKRIEVPNATFDPDDLMEKLRLGNALASALPESFTTFWTSCYEDVYGDLTINRPQVGAETLQDAYALTWLVLWFQTSPESIGCQASAPAAPGDCGGAPSWTNPAIPGDAGGGAGGPPPPTIDPKLKPENIICAILLAIFGVVSLAFGGWIAGGAAIAGAIYLVATAGTIDWDKLRCDLAWYRLYMYNGLRALHDLMSLGALVHPYKFELSTDTTPVSLLADIPTEIKTGDHLLLSRPSKERYPARPWDGSGFGWYNDVSDPVESEPTQPALSAAYPSSFIDDPANPQGSGSPFKAPTGYPYTAGSTGTPLGFKNSTDAVLAWLPGDDVPLPDWNLDGDRGLGFRTWHFVDDEWTNPVNLEPEA